jgi:transposase-like protein
LYKWRKEYEEFDKEVSVMATLANPEQENESPNLKGKLKDAELERDILKAIGIFPKNGR